jgi:hypothetical protein
MDEVEVSKSEETQIQKSTENEKAAATSLDINEIVGKVRDFVGNIKDMSAGGKPMAVSVEGFNVSAGKKGDEYTLGVQLNLVFKPKESSL